MRVMPRDGSKDGRSDRHDINQVAPSPLFFEDSRSSDENRLPLTVAVPIIVALSLASWLAIGLIVTQLF